MTRQEKLLAILGGAIGGAAALAFGVPTYLATERFIVGRRNARRRRDAGRFPYPTNVTYITNADAEQIMRSRSGR